MGCSGHVASEMNLRDRTIQGITLKERTSWDQIPEREYSADRYSYIYHCVAPISF